MKWMRMLGLGEMSPLGVLVAGALIGAAGLPAIKRGARGIVVSSVGAALSASDFIKNLGGNVSREWHELVEDARDKRVVAGDGVKEHLRGAGVELAGAGLAVAEMAREKYRDVKENIGDKVAHFRETGEEAIEKITEDVIENVAENNLEKISDRVDTMEKSADNDDL